MSGSLGPDQRVFVKHRSSVQIRQAAPASNPSAKLVPSHLALRVFRHTRGARHPKRHPTNAPSCPQLSSQLLRRGEPLSIGAGELAPLGSRRTGIKFQAAPRLEDAGNNSRPHAQRKGWRRSPRCWRHLAVDQETPSGGCDFVACDRRNYQDA